MPSINWKHIAIHIVCTSCGLQYCHSSGRRWWRQWRQKPYKRIGNPRLQFQRRGESRNSIHSHVFFLSFRSDSVLKACLLLIITLLYYMKKKMRKKNIPPTVCCCRFYIVCSSYMFFGFILTFIPSCFFPFFLLLTGNCIHCCYSEYNGTRIANRAHFSIYFHLIHNKVQKLCMFFFASILALSNFTCQL